MFMERIYHFNAKNIAGSLGEAFRAPNRFLVPRVLLVEEIQT